MRLVKLVILAVLAVVLAIIALANRGPMTFRLLPDELARLAGFNWQISLPVFVVLLGAVLAGVALGFVWEWAREHKHRVTARTERQERQRLEREVKKVAPPSQAGGDDILAIIEGR